eukprot:scaffold93682_cov60-Phaeocystis_antarctica.AAC.1
MRNLLGIMNREICSRSTPAAEEARHAASSHGIEPALRPSKYRRTRTKPRAPRTWACRSSGLSSKRWSGAWRVRGEPALRRAR